MKYSLFNWLKTKFILHFLFVFFISLVYIITPPTLTCFRFSFLFVHYLAFCVYNVKIFFRVSITWIAIIRRDETRPYPPIPAITPLKTIWRLSGRIYRRDGVFRGKSELWFNFRPLLVLYKLKTTQLIQQRREKQDILYHT